MSYSESTAEGVPSIETLNKQEFISLLHQISLLFPVDDTTVERLKEIVKFTFGKGEVKVEYKFAGFNKNGDPLFAVEGKPNERKVIVENDIHFSCLISIAEAVVSEIDRLATAKTEKATEKRGRYITPPKKETRSSPILISVDYDPTAKDIRLLGENNRIEQRRIQFDMVEVFNRCLRFYDKCLPEFAKALRGKFPNGITINDTQKKELEYAASLGFDFPIVFPPANTLFKLDGINYHEKMFTIFEKMNCVLSISNSLVVPNPNVSPEFSTFDTMENPYIRFFHRGPIPPSARYYGSDRALESTKTMQQFFADFLVHEFAIFSRLLAEAGGQLNKGGGCFCFGNYSSRDNFVPVVSTADGVDFVIDNQTDSVVLCPSHVVTL